MRQNIAASDAQSLQRTVSILREGGVVAFPTDTVYGVGCDAFAEDAISRIYALKRRGREKPLVMLLADTRSVLSFAKRPGKSLTSVCEHFLPGPLTIIVRAKRSSPPGLVSRKGSISIRVPDYAFIRQVIKRLDRPLATTSANLSGKGAPWDYRSITIDVDLVVRDNNATSGMASSVLDTSVFPFVLRRRGQVSIYALERFISSRIRFDESIPFRVLFVCTGNSCRSPMAEAMMRTMLEERKLSSVSVSSCGLRAGGGYPATENARLALESRGYAMGRHRSRSIADTELEQADLILCMERGHRNEIQDRFPEVAHKTYLITEYCGGRGEVQDPIGRDLPFYETVAGQIERCVRNVAEELTFRYGKAKKKRKR